MQFGSQSSPIKRFVLQTAPDDRAPGWAAQPFIFIITGNYLKLCCFKSAKLRHAGLYSGFA
jgi:hypothetical protein